MNASAGIIILIFLISNLSLVIIYCGLRSNGFLRYCLLMSCLRRHCLHCFWKKRRGLNKQAHCCGRLMKRNGLAKCW
jgi:hypothetical protein